MLLAKLRESGLRVTSDGGAVIVEPRGCITDQARAIIRTHKLAILQELARERANHREAISAASQAARLDDFRASLLLGHQHLCANCAHFTFDADPASPGTCGVFGEKPAPFAPFKCVSFKASTKPVAPSFLPDQQGEFAIEREHAKPVLPLDILFNDPIPDLAAGARQ